MRNVVMYNKFKSLKKLLRTEVRLQLLNGALLPCLWTEQPVSSTHLEVIPHSARWIKESAKFERTRSRKFTPLSESLYWFKPVVMVVVVVVVVVNSIILHIGKLLSATNQS
jgi:hypothetical protein